MKPPNTQNQNSITLAVDVMGGDRGVRPLLKGLSDSLKENPRLRYLIFGRSEIIEPALRKFSSLKSKSEIRHCDDIVSMDDKPSQIMRNGKKTSMYEAIQAVKNGEAEVAVSCGNTGALMALSMLILRKAPYINRPAIAILWPSSNVQGFNVLLDAGADIRAEAQDLLQYAIMGASFSRNLYDIHKPRIGILNVGTEEGKGRQELSQAAEMIENSKKNMGIEFIGFVEGSDIADNKVDVIVTDGFTGNVALKAGEGVARFIRFAMSETFKENIFSRLGAIAAYPAIRSMSKKIDPRRANGGVFLGLGGTVIKSHGGSDSIAMASAIQMAFTLAEKEFNHRVNERMKRALKDKETISDA